MRRWWLLFISMLLIITPVSPAFSAVPNNPNVFPFNHPPQDPNGYQPNRQLYDMYSVVVYGNPSNVPQNRYKKGIQYDNGYIDYSGGGHFDGGEYVYLGFDENGNPFFNKYFIDDATSSTELQDKKWIYNPRDNLPNWLPSKLKGKDYGDMLPAEFESWIDRSIPFPLTNGTGGIANQYNKRPYLFVNSLPSSQAYGVATMWHQTSNGQYWFQTFMMDKLQQSDRRMTPLDAQIEILNHTPIVLANGETGLKLDVKVKGFLQDEDYFGDKNLSRIYYNRSDIKSWTINLNEFGMEVPANQNSGVKNAYDNYGEATFSLNFTREQLQQNPVIILNATAHVHFNDNAENTARINQNVPVEIQGSDLIAKFNVNETIILNKPDDFTPLVIGYADASIGDITAYNIEITNNSSDGQTTSFTYPQIDNVRVNQDLLGFMSPYFHQEGNKSETFTITQTIQDRYGKTTSYALNTKVTLRKNPVWTLTSPNPDVPDDALDIVPFPARDQSDMNVFVSRKLTIDGVPVDDYLFFNGYYTFGIGSVGLHQIDITYQTSEGIKYYCTEWVMVHDTKPRAQFTLDGNSFKENRRMTVQNNSLDANDTYVTDRYPLHYQWRFLTYDGNESSLRMKQDDVMNKEFLYKKQGLYGIELIATNDLGRTSNPYLLKFPIREDLAPEVILHPWNGVVSRGDRVKFNYDVESLDQDLLVSEESQILFDSDNDGSYEQTVATISGPLTDYQPSAIGRYRVVTTVREEFGERTIPEFVTPEDRKTTVQQTDFAVDNYQPNADLYVDIPIIKPQLDLFIMNDKDLGRSKNEYIMSNNVTLRNYMAAKNTLPEMHSWDMHTYVYSKYVSNVPHNTGSTSPPSTWYYSTDPGGYKGTLQLSSQSDNGRNVDFGTDTTVTESQTFTATCTNTVSVIHYSNGGISQSPIRECESYKDINSNGYSGPIPKTDTTAGPPTEWTDSSGDWHQSQTWTAYYSGTLTKLITHHEYDWRWVPNYTGFYNGTIYKDVREPYANPWTRNEAQKYVIYVSDGTISELNDLNMVLSKADAKVILIGQDGMQNQIAHDHFFLNNKPIDQIMKDALDYIASTNPAIQEYYTLVGQPFQMQKATYDKEHDPITEDKFLYVQNPYVFDNAQGYESFAASWHDLAQYTTYQADHLDKPGKYEIFRRVKDQPSSNPNFAEFSYYSNEAQLNIIAHRKPIARTEMEWDFNLNEGLYHVNFVDQSYDLDHEYNRPDKGIVERKMRYQKVGGEWIYNTPTTLSPGTYRFEYTVQDPEHAWSDPFVIDKTLPSSPPIQLEAQARPLQYRFTMNSIPASEDLELYDITTRWPNNLYLEVGLFQNGVSKTPIKRVDLTSSTGYKYGNDINWNNITYTIPSDLPDGDYSLRITAVGTKNDTASLNFPVNVRTPVDLEIVDFPDEMVVNDLTYDLKARTSKYVTTASITLFRGTSYQKTLPLTGTIDPYDPYKKNWIYLGYKVPANVPEGTYVFDYKATTSNGVTGTASALSHIVSSYIRPDVLHAPEWNQIRIDYNQKRTGTADDPRGPHVFWSGESFLLDANTSTGNAVNVTMLETGKTVSLTPSNQNKHWTGKLWDGSFQSLRNGLYNFRFDLNYGPTYAQKVKSATVQVMVVDSWNNQFPMHRNE